MDNPEETSRTFTEVNGETWLQHISLAAVHARVETVGPTWFCPRRRLYNHALIVFRSGTWFVEFDGKQHRFDQDTFIIIPPGISSFYYYAGSEPATQCWSHFDWCYIDRPRPACAYYSEHVAAVPAEFLRPAPEWVPKGVLMGSVPMPDYIYELFDKLSARCRALDSRLRLTARSVLLEILLLLLGPYEAPLQHDRQSKIFNAVHDLRLKLDHASTCPVGSSSSLEQLAAESGYSCGHISREFKQVFGVSPGEYVMRRRFHRARQLLAETRLPIGEICQQVGFGYFSHFSRQFKHHVGVSPLAYRQQSRDIT